MGAFRKLARHNIQRWALTGGFAIEIHRLRRGRQPSLRPLNDIDFITDSFDYIPGTLAHDFLFRHIHPSDPPGKTLLQSIDPENALRIDVFRAYGATMSRTSHLDFPVGAIQLISLEDLLARAARLALDLAEGVPTEAKHVTDFLHLAGLINPAEVETAWRDQRKPKHPATFEEASGLLHKLIPASHGLLITPDYSKDIEAVCPRCTPTAAFHLADPSVVLSLLGYC
ncbi:MAG: hypothetical protein ACRD8O_04025 [Bryobacteraceae bacterium]